jgi:hypothetical protein
MTGRGEDKIGVLRVDGATDRSFPDANAWMSAEAMTNAHAYARTMMHSMKMMWGCAALVAFAIVLAAVGVTGAYFVLFALPCVLMMGAMVWMMVRGMSGGSRGGHAK